MVEKSPTQMSDKEFFNYCKKNPKERKCNTISAKKRLVLAKDIQQYTRSTDLFLFGLCAGLVGLFALLLFIIGYFGL